jgi:glutaredoxin 3
VKEYLSKNNVAFQERNVAVDRDAAKEMIEKTKQMGVPVIIIDDRDIVIGFDQSKLNELLNLKG